MSIRPLLFDLGPQFTRPCAICVVRARHSRPMLILVARSRGERQRQRETREVLRTSARRAASSVKPSAMTLSTRCRARSAYFAGFSFRTSSASVPHHCDKRYGSGAHRRSTFRSSCSSSVTSSAPSSVRRFASAAACPVGRGHVSLSTDLDTRHSKPFRDIGHLLRYYLRRRVRRRLRAGGLEPPGETHPPPRRLLPPPLARSDAVILAESGSNDSKISA